MLNNVGERGQSSLTSISITNFSANFGLYFMEMMLEQQ